MHLHTTDALYTVMREFFVVTETTCPMNGPTVTRTGTTTTRVAAFTTGGTVGGRGFDDYAYWAMSTAEGAWAQHVPTPDHVRSERYPTAVVGGASGN